MYEGKKAINVSACIWNKKIYRSFIFNGFLCRLRLQSARTARFVDEDELSEFELETLLLRIRGPGNISDQMESSPVLEIFFMELEFSVRSVVVIFGYGSQLLGQN